MNKLERVFFYCPWRYIAGLYFKEGPGSTINGIMHDMKSTAWAWKVGDKEQGLIEGRIFYVDKLHLDQLDNLFGDRERVKVKDSFKRTMWVYQSKKKMAVREAVTSWPTPATAALIKNTRGLPEGLELARYIKPTTRPNAAWILAYYQAIQNTWTNEKACFKAELEWAASGYDTLTSRASQKLLAKLNVAQAENVTKSAGSFKKLASLLTVGFELETQETNNTNRDSVGARTDKYNNRLTVDEKALRAATLQKFKSLLAISTEQIE